MADARHVKIKIDIKNLEETIKMYRQLAEDGGELGSSAVSGLKSLQKLMKAVQSGSKVTSSEVDEYWDTIKRMNESIDLLISKHGTQTTKIKETISTLTKETKQLEISLAKSKKLVESVRNTNTTEHLFTTASTKKLYKSENVTKEQIKLAGKFSSLEEAQTWARKSLKNSGGKDKTPEEQARIKVAQEIIRIYKELETTVTQVENKFQAEVDQTTAALTRKTNEINRNKKALKTLESQPIGVAKKAKAGVSQTGDELSRAHFDLKRLGNTTAQLSSEKNSAFEMSSKGLIKAINITHLYKQVLRESVQAIRELDDAITNMTVVTGESREETEKYVQTFAEVARASSSTITEIANLTTEYARQGRTVADSLILAEETAKAAKIAGISVADSLTYMTSAINGFNLEASDAAHVSDVFAKVAAETATDYNQLAVALSKVSAQANQAGMSIEYTTALLAKGIETTQEAPESIGTALKTIIARFRELSDYGSTLEDGVDVNKVEAALGAVGIELRTTTGEFRSLEDVFNELGPKWDDLTTMQRQAIAQAAAGTRQQSRFLAIMQDWNRTIDITTMAEEAAGAAAAQYAKYAEGMTAAITNLESSWQSFVTSLTESEWIIDGINVATNLLSGVAKLIDNLGAAVPAIALGVVGVVKAVQLRNTWQQKELQLLEKEIAQRRAINTQSKEEAKTQKEKAKMMIDNAKDELIATRDQEIAETTATLRIKLEAQQQHIQKLKNIKEEAVAKEKDHIQDLRRIKSKLEAEGKSTEKVDAKIREAERQKNKVRDSYQAQIREAQKEELAIQQEISNVEQEITNNYKPALDSLDALSEQINSVDGQLANMVSGVKNLFGSIQGGVKGVLADFSKLSKKNGGFKAFSQTNTAKSIGTAATAALITTAITLASTAISEMINLEKNTMAEIARITSHNYDLASNASGVAKLRDEYDELSKKVHRTAEEEQRLQEIQETMKKDHNIDVTNLDDFDEAITQYNVEIAKNTEQTLAEAFRLSIRKGAEMWEQTEFKTLVSARLNNLNEADTSTAEGRYQSEQYQKMVNNYDSAGMAGEITNKYKGKATGGNVAAGIGAGVGGAAVGMAAGVGTALITAGALSAIPVAGWIAAGVIAAGTAIFATWKAIEANSSKTAEKMAREMAEETAKVAKDFNDFSESMAETYDNTLGAQFNQYNATMDAMADTMGERSKEAIKKSYQGFEIIKEMGLDSTILDALQQVQRDIDGNIIEIGFSNEAMNKMITQAGELGKDAGKAFIKTWQDITATGADAKTTAALLASSLNGASTEDMQAMLIKQGYSAEEAASIATSAQSDAGTLALDQSKKDKEEARKKKEAAQVDLDTFYNMDYNDFIKRNKEYKGMSYSEIEAKLKGEVDAAAEEFDKAGAAMDDLTDTLLQSISSFDNLQSLGQGLTSMDSAIKNANEFADRLAEGTTTIDDWVNAGTQYADLLTSEEWKTASAEERADMIRAGSSIFDTHTRREDEIDDFKLRTETDANIAKGKIDEQIAALDVNAENYEELKKQYEDQKAAIDKQTEATLIAADAMKDLSESLTEAEIEKIAYDNAIKHADKKIADGDFSGYTDKMTILDNSIATQKSDMDDYWSRMEKQAQQAGYSTEGWRDMMDQMLQGNTEAYEAWAATADKNQLAAFETLWNTYSEDVANYETSLEDKEALEEEYTNKKIEAQNKAVEIMKAKLEQEYEDTKTSLEKRRDLYTKYFDSLDAEEDEADYEADRQTLLNKIASLSTATDSESLAKLKEAQEALAELDDEQLQSERDMRREAVEESFDTQEQQLEDAYNSAMENVQGLWEEFISMQAEDQKALFLQYGEEFKNVTDAALEVAKKALDTSMGQYGGVSDWGPAYAEGGLVNYTGPAWVDGTPSKPEAFLDAVDTANIANLAQGLRAMMTGSFGLGNSKDNNTVTINELNINVNGSADGQAIGQGAADGFMKAIRDLGININKQG